jgi:hypothetical protein
LAMGMRDMETVIRPKRPTNGMAVVVISAVIASCLCLSTPACVAVSTTRAIRDTTRPRTPLFILAAVFRGVGECAFYCDTMTVA